MARPGRSAKEERLNEKERALCQHSSVQSVAALMPTGRNADHRKRQYVAAIPDRSHTANRHLAARDIVNPVGRHSGRSAFRHRSKTQDIITALHAMQTRSSDENSVRLSVCLSVCLSVTRVHCDKTVERSVQIYTPYERTFMLVFCKEEWLVGGDPFYKREILGQPTPIGTKSPIFNQ